MEDETPPSLLARIVEPRRLALGLSVRRAAERTGMSEAGWRQLTRGGVSVRGAWVPRVPRRDQLLAMAAAVGDDAFAVMVDALAATSQEQEDALSRVYIPDPAEEEILASRHLTAEEKLHLVSTLRQLRRRADERAGSVPPDAQASPRLAR